MKSVRTGRSPLVSLGLSINSEMTNLALESESGLGRGVAWIPIQRRSSHPGWGYFNSFPWGLRWDSFAFMWILRRVGRRCRFCRSCVSRVLFFTVDHFFLISLDLINQKYVLWIDHRQRIRPCLLFNMLNILCSCLFMILCTRESRCLSV